MYNENDWKLATQFLVQFMYEYPNEKSISTVLGVNFSDSWPLKGANNLIDTGCELLDMCQQQEPDRLLLDIIQDYSELFCGPGVPLSPPWASYYIDERNQLNTASTIEYKEFVLSLFPEFNNYENHPFDHVGIHLSFIYALIDNYGLSEKRVQSYYDEHLKSWIEDFSDKFLENAKSDFYLGVAYLFKGYINCLSELSKPD